MLMDKVSLVCVHGLNCVSPKSTKQSLKANFVATVSTGLLFVSLGSFIKHNIADTNITR